jgi:AcrR family transcriptional regulator
MRSGVLALSDGTSTKDRILASALALFAEKGYEGTTVQDIARGVGIKAASLYAHFRGKKAIFRGVFDRALLAWDAAIADSFSGAQKDSSLADGLLDILYRYALHAMKTETYRFWARLYIFPPPILKEKDAKAFRDLDVKFAMKLYEYCDVRMRAGKRGTGVTPLVSSLVRLAWGFVLCGAPEDAGTMKREMKEGVGLLLKGFQSV